MESFRWYADPWWVNLLILVPLLTYALLRKKGIALPKRQLALAGLFGVAFGFVEAATVAYLRYALGVPPTASSGAIQAVVSLSQSLIVIEIIREVATLAMLMSVAFLGSQGRRERWALFLWTFALWDLFYYVGLRLAIGWPPSFLTYDALFLIPEVWLAQVWFPLLVDGLSLLAVGAVAGSW